MEIATLFTKCGGYFLSVQQQQTTIAVQSTKPFKEKTSRETNIPTATTFGRPVAYQPRPLSSPPHFQYPLQFLFLEPPSAEQDNPNEMAVQLWETLKEAIPAYTGLSPTTFFTFLALGLAVYYVVSGLFGSSSDDHHRRPRDFSKEQMEPLPPPVQLGEVTEEELTLYDGKDPKKPLLMAIKGQIYDVSQSRMFYGPGGPYALFAGKDASRALAKMSFEEKDLTGDISGLGPFELDALQDWEYKFMSKYVKVGTIKETVPLTEGSSSDAKETIERDVQNLAKNGPTSETSDLRDEVQNLAKNGPTSETSDLRDEDAPSASKADE